MIVRGPGSRYRLLVLTREEASMKFLRGFTLTVGLLLCVSLGNIRGKGSLPPQSGAQSNPGSAGVQAESDPQANSSSVVSAANITFTTITVPGAGYTGIFDINTAGVMVGNYGQNISTDSHGFTYSNGTFTYFDYPGQNETVPGGINDSGLIVGYATSAGSTFLRGFSYNGTTFTTLRDGSNTATYTTSINNAGVVVGGAGSIYGVRGFELRGKTYKDLSPPGIYVSIQDTGINNLGEVVGWTDNDGFLYAQGKFVRVDFPGASSTESWRISDSGMIVGWYTTSGPPYLTYSFARSSTGKFISFTYPGATTFAFGVNGAGQIVGEYTFDNQAFYGFVTSPVTLAEFQ
jgi:hypothetical protein